MKVVMGRVLSDTNLQSLYCALTFHIIHLNFYKNGKSLLKEHPTTNYKKKIVLNNHKKENTRNFH